MISKVISGGQTGIDQIGLKAARAAGIPTGGTAPKRFRTENGSKPELGTIFGLVEHDSWQYDPRTEQNVIDSDATILFGDMTSTGSKLTIKFLKKHRRPYLENPDFETLKKFVFEKTPNILNIAGNRGSKLTEFQRSSVGLLLLTFFKFMINHTKSVPAIFTEDIYTK